MADVSPAELVICIHEGQHVQAEEALVVVVQTTRLCWVVDGYVLAIHGLVGVLMSCHILIDDGLAPSKTIPLMVL